MRTALPAFAAVRTPSRRFLLGALCATALAAGLGAAAPGAGAAESDTDSLVTFPGTLAAPSLKLADLAGRVHDVPDYRGRVLVVNFWATWCGPCVAEMASMERAWTALRAKGVDVVAVNAGDAADKVHHFLELHPVSFPVLLDPTTRIAAAWHVGALPTTYVVDGAGEITAGALGGLDWDAPAVRAKLTRLAAATGSPGAAVKASP